MCHVMLQVCKKISQVGLCRNRGKKECLGGFYLLLGCISDEFDGCSNKNKIIVLFQSIFISSD